MNGKRWLLIAAMVGLGLLLSGCMPNANVEDGAAVQPTADPVQARAVDKVPTPDINALPLQDDASLYRQQDPASLSYFYVTVRGGTAADGTNHTLAEVNSYINLQSMVNVQKIKTGIVFQVGDATGPLPGEVGYDAVMSNATMNVRGRTSTLAPQKSYRIDLYDSAGLWRGQRAIALNKHPYDRTRLRNMLFFNLLQKVPGMTSLRMQFVQLFVKDETAGETAFTDYGLYTQVEVPNGRYLRNHSLSRNGNLYKANFCELYRYPDQLKLATDPAYDLAAFSQVLEPKTGDDHQKLLAMLDAVNDFSIPIEKTIETYFDLDNLTSFLAFNILMGNVDTNSQNYLLYSPLNADTWYFLCWDGDGCLDYYESSLFGTENEISPWQRGITNYWGMRLFNRMLRVAEYRQALVDKMALLRTLITPAMVEAMIRDYRSVTDAFTTRMPDLINLNCTLEQQELLYRNMPGDLDTAYGYFETSLKQPMPFFLGNVARDGKTLSFAWGEAFSFAAETIHYTLQVASDWSFAPDTIVFETSPQLPITANIPMLPPGDYVWRVTAVNESGYEMGAFDWFMTGDQKHFGMRRFTVTDTGEVLNPE